MLFAQRFQTDRSDPYHPVDETNDPGCQLCRHPLQVAPPHLSNANARHRIRSRSVVWADDSTISGRDIREWCRHSRRRWRAEAFVLITASTDESRSRFASGDNDPRDSTIRQFTFNQSYTVGLVLFKHVLPLISARSIDRLADPDLLDVPPYALRFTVNQGAVRNAAYAYPNVRWHMTEQWAVRFAYLYAQRAADAVDPYQSAIAGGYNTAVGGGQPGGRELGHEIDAAIDFKYRLHGVEFGLSAENGGFSERAFAGVLDNPCSQHVLYKAFTGRGMT